MPPAAEQGASPELGGEKAARATKAAAAAVDRSQG